MALGERMSGLFSVLIFFMIVAALRWFVCATLGFTFGGELTERGKRRIAREAMDDWVEGR